MNERVKKQALEPFMPPIFCNFDQQISGFSYFLQIFSTKQSLLNLRDKNFYRKMQLSEKLHESEVNHWSSASYEFSIIIFQMTPKSFYRLNCDRSKSINRYSIYPPSNDKDIRFKCFSWVNIWQLTYFFHWWMVLICFFIYRYSIHLENAIFSP